ncbi:hypothetical protein PR048_019622 [Dryococelus australis]|uniref:Uncharacterized protein n=1 Tax=Dryococelus australis TaxID=614101 RepID=A0ABQ9H3Z4_9NEOP|nr:hypothetical protein PR048_019622 [Dryococelus australis]
MDGSRQRRFSKYSLRSNQEGVDGCRHLSNYTEHTFIPNATKECPIVIIFYGHATHIDGMGSYARLNRLLRLYETTVRCQESCRSYIARGRPAETVHAPLESLGGRLDTCCLVRFYPQRVTRNSHQKGASNLAPDKTNLP